MAEPTRQCAICGKPVGRKSRYWCDDHVLELGTVRLRVTPEVIEKVRPKRRAFIRKWIARS